MASQLTGRLLQLTWSDFMAPPPAGFARRLDGVEPDRNTFLAATASDFKATFGGGPNPNFDQIPGAATFKLRDDVTFAVVFDKTKSWKVIDHLTTNGKDLLLDHEQGHYDITALTARDCFIDVMQLKQRAFDSAPSGTQEVQGVIARYRQKLAALQKKYDWDTNHGSWGRGPMGAATKGSEQNRWEAFIRRAFTEDRRSGDQAPDGATYKVRLIDVAREGVIARNETPDFSVTCLLHCR
jgi:hypothetical protein